MYYDLKESGMRIKKLRKAAGYTQEKLAENVGVTVDTLGRIERGVKGASVDTLGTIAEFLNSSVDYLAFGKLNIAGIAIPSDKEEMIIKVVKAILEG